jgi:hypothetical protein
MDNILRHFEGLKRVYGISFSCPSLSLSQYLLMICQQLSPYEQLDPELMVRYLVNLPF